MKVERRLTKGDVAKIILETVKAATSITSALVAPNSLIALKKLGIIDLDYKHQKSILNTKFRMIRQGYLAKNNKGFIRLTDLGQERLKKYELRDYKLTIPKFWDKKWRILIFDIPESRRGTRQKVRNTLKSIGFYRLQDSVWVFPYDCSELISLLKADFKIGKDLLYIIGDDIENDKKIRSYFNL